MSARHMIPVLFGLLVAPVSCTQSEPDTAPAGALGGVERVDVERDPPVLENKSQPMIMKVDHKVQPVENKASPKLMLDAADAENKATPRVGTVDHKVAPLEHKIEDASHKVAPNPDVTGSAVDAKPR